MSETKWTPGMWEVDAISASTEDFDYDSYAVIDEDGNIIVDALNSGVSSIEREGPDEEGHVDRWDEQARRNCTFIASAPALYKALEAYERWEADLIMSQEAWAPEGTATLPTIPQHLWDRLIEIQSKRNDALAQARGETK